MRFPKFLELQYFFKKKGENLTKSLPLSPFSFHDLTTY